MSNTERNYHKIFAHALIVWIWLRYQIAWELYGGGVLSTRVALATTRQTYIATLTMAYV